MRLCYHKDMKKYLNKNKYTIFGFIWIIIAMYLAVETRYQNSIAEFADPMGTSTPQETFLRFIIVIISFLPGTAALLYALANDLVKKKTVSMVAVSILSLFMSVVLYFTVFALWNFVINYPK